MAHLLRSFCLNCSLVAAFLLVGQGASAQAKKPVGPSPFPQFESAIENRKKDLGGDLLVFVANRNSVLYQKGFGDVTLRTQSPLGMASSWLTMALVLQLVDDGLFSLDDKVAQYLPVFASYAKNYVTIRHLLTGYTGVQSEPFRTANVAGNRYESLEAEAAGFAKREIKANAGEAQLYNPTGLNVVARVAEVVTKKKFEQLMRQRILTPLGMRNTSFTTDDGSAPNPMGGAKSTATDMIRFLQMLLNNGSFGGKQILSAASVAELRKVQVAASQIKATPKLLQGYALTLGASAVDETEGAGKAATVLVAPGFTGAWTLVDFARGYAFVLLPKTFSGEQNANVYTGLKLVLDEEMKRGKK